MSLTKKKNYNQRNVTFKNRAMKFTNDTGDIEEMGQ